MSIKVSNKYFKLVEFITSRKKAKAVTSLSCFYFSKKFDLIVYAIFC